MLGISTKLCDAASLCADSFHIDREMVHTVVRQQCSTPADNGNGQPMGLVAATLPGGRGFLWLLLKIGPLTKAKVTGQASSPAAPLRDTMATVRKARRDCSAEMGAGE